MCGLTGFLFFTGESHVQDHTSDLHRMAALMDRRGPNDQGTWLDPEGRVGLGFRRLSILDLTTAGHQPMESTSGRSVILLNGEIYNYLDLKHDLESKGFWFRSRTDTEVLLAALETWGAAAISRLNGMFAFAWYDRSSRSLLLARDHAGIKPLYYFIEPSGKGIAFGSQYNQLLASPWGIPRPIQLDVLNLYLRLHHIPPPYGLLKNTYQLEPGHYLQIGAGGKIEDRAWWILPRSPNIDLKGEEALGAARQAIEHAIARQRVADVPLGVFLSGGIDSPLVSAVTHKQHGPGLRAYTIGNPGWRQDEATDARCYAEYLGVDFHLHNVSGDEMLALLPEVWKAQYEPFGDFSILPALLISRFAREGLTVALSGDGGDELFFGYERPLSLLRNGIDFRFPWIFRYGLYAAGKLGIGPRRSEVIAAHSPADYYFGVNCRFRQSDLSKVAPDLPGIPSNFKLYHFDRYQGVKDLANYSRYVEFYGQLQRGLKKVDMASMHFSLEVRAPLLDREVIDTSLRIDPFTHMENRKRKQVLHKLLAMYVPSEIIPAVKRGFAVPMGEWLKGPLRPLIEEMLLAKNLYPQGLFDHGSLQKYWEAHLHGEADHKWGLWTLLSLQGWVQYNL